MKRPRRFWFWFWMIWLGTFLGAEAYGLFVCDGGCTLSESIWFLQREWWPLTIGLGVLLVWLIFHFIFDKRSRS